MKIPKYIQSAIKNRAKAASSFNRYDLIITHWCRDRNIETEEIGGSLDSIAHPFESAEQLKKDILKK